MRSTFHHRPVLALCALCLTVVVPLFAATTKPQPPAPVTPPVRTVEMAGFEAPWIGYFNPDFCFYIAVRDPNVEGPLLKKAVGMDALERAEEKAPNKSFSEVRKRLMSLVDAAKKDKIIDKEMSELVSGGFAMGLSPALKGDEAIGFLVVPRSAKLDRFFEWSLARIKKEHGPNAVKDVRFEGFPGWRIDAPGKVKPVVAKGDKVYLFSNREEQIVSALRLAKSGGENISRLKAYKRARARLLPDAAMFLVLNPIPALDLIKPAQVDPEQQKRVAEARKSLEAIDCVVLQLAGNPKTAHIDLAVIMDAASPSAKRMGQVLAAKTIKASGVVGHDVPAFLSLIRPTDVTAVVNDEPTKEKITTQLQTLKGTLQMQTGLEYEKDVAPWWGQEVSLAVALPEDQVPEVALVLESTNPGLSAAAVDKMVRHLSVTQNRQFEEKKAGPATYRIVKSGDQPQKAPVNPAVCAKDNVVILATGGNVIEAIMSSQKKLATNPAYASLARSLPADRMALALYLKTELLTKAKASIAKAQGAQAPADPATAFTEQVESLLVGLGTPDAETVQLTIYINGK